MEVKATQIWNILYKISTEGLMNFISKFEKKCMAMRSNIIKFY